MTEQNIQLSRRGARKFEVNPFVQGAATSTQTGFKRITDKTGTRMMVVSQKTGEVMAPAGFWQAQEVDKTQFVKLYVNGVKAFRDLTSAGTKVFEVLYLKVQESIGKDILSLVFYDVDQAITPMSGSTFMRGIRELVAKGFIAESYVSGRYFLNPDYMWNGDRLAFVKEYRIAGRSKEKDTLTGDLFIENNNLFGQLTDTEIALERGRIYTAGQAASSGK
jgi:hypothetical protein